MIEKVLEERGNRYGTFADHAKIAQALIEVIRSQPKWLEMKPDARQAVTVICDKIARMLNGDPEYDDNWIDIIGYATLVLNRMKSDQRNKALDEMVAMDQSCGLYDDEELELTEELEEARAANEGMVYNVTPPTPQSDALFPPEGRSIELGEEGYFIRKHDEKANDE